jgi:hypothetical protein
MGGWFCSELSLKARAKEMESLTNQVGEVHFSVDNKLRDGGQTVAKVVANVEEVVIRSSYPKPPKKGRRERFKESKQKARKD